MIEIKNDVDQLTIVEQKTILSADAYFIVSENLVFNCLLLRIKKEFTQWTPNDIDAAIIYLKKNNLVQIFKL